MYPEPITRYLVPQTCREAAAFKSAHPEAVFLAGGQSLLPQLKSRVRRAATIIDLNRVTDAVACTIDERELRLAALVRYRDVIGNGAIGEHFPALHDAIREIGDRQVRNRGTPVGSLAHADPTGDIAPVALVFDGVLETADADDARTIVPFDPATVAALPFIAAVTLCRRGGSAFVKHNRVAQDRAIVNVAAALDLDDAHLCRNVRVAVGGIAPYAMRLAAVE